MDFLNKLVIPLSPEHIQLLHYVLILIFFLFIPFISIVICGTAVSLYYRSKGIKNKNSNYLRFAKEIIKTLTVNKSMGLVLGVLTLLTSILIYIQLLHTANVGTVNYLLLSVIFLIVSLVLIYTYRYSITFTDIFDSIEEFKPSDESVSEDINELKTGSKRLSIKSGVYGLVFLFIAVWLFIGGVTLAGITKDWNSVSIISLLFSASVISRLIAFLAAAAAFSGGTILFRYFYWEGGVKNLDDDYRALIKKVGLTLASVGSVILPVFLLTNLLSLPDNSLSSSVFTFTVIALVLIFLSYQLLYVMISSKTVKYSAPVFFIILFTIMSMIVKDQVAMANATKPETLRLKAKYEQVMQKFEAPAKAPKISGMKIYQNICSACHRFDKKLVGPPYEQTLPKYKGNVDKLVTFILNPKQNNPGYPPMPNPGLNRAQAHAVATYILKEVKKYE